MDRQAGGLAAKQGYRVATLRPVRLISSSTAQQLLAQKSVAQQRVAQQASGLPVLIQPQYTQSQQIDRAMSTHTPPVVFDELDYRIIQELRANGRAEAAKIARAVEVNERTVRKRIDRLINSGAVSVTAVVDQRTFGYVAAVFVMLEVEPEAEEQVVAQFRNMQELTFLAYGLGSRDLLLQACFKDNDEMREFLRRTLPSMPGVTVTATILVPRVLRNITGWMPSMDDFERAGHPGNTGPAA